jgi:hypothetical protein
MTYNIESVSKKVSISLGHDRINVVCGRTPVPCSFSRCYFWCNVYNYPPLLAWSSPTDATLACVCLFVLPYIRYCPETAVLEKYLWNRNRIPRYLKSRARVNTNYGQLLCQNPRSIQKHCANVLVLPTIVLAVFYTGDRIQSEIRGLDFHGLVI